MVTATQHQTYGRDKVYIPIRICVYVCTSLTILYIPCIRERLDLPYVLYHIKRGLFYEARDFAYVEFRTVNSILQIIKMQNQQANRKHIKKEPQQRMNQKGTERPYIGKYYRLWKSLVPIPIYFQLSSFWTRTEMHFTVPFGVKCFCQAQLSFHTEVEGICDFWWEILRASGQFVVISLSSLLMWKHISSLITVVRNPLLQPKHTDHTEHMNSQ